VLKNLVVKAYVIQVLGLVFMKALRTERPVSAAVIVVVSAFASRAHAP
jgi:hypothetical protein